MKLFDWFKKPKTIKPKTTKPDPNTKYYKVLGKNQTSCWGGKHTWKSNEWTPRIEDIKPCKVGWHLCRFEDILRWLNEEIWEVELAEDAEIIEGLDKVVTTGPIRITKQLNWNKQKAIMFAADCAEHVLHLFEDAYPTDDRPREAIEAARNYAKDMSEENREKAYAADNAYTDDDADYAADNAARAAAAATAYAARAAAAYANVNAADAAAYAYANAADAAYAACAADNAAIHAAIHAGVYVAAGAAAAERKWQVERLRALLYETH